MTRSCISCKCHSCKKTCNCGICKFFLKDKFGKDCFIQECDEYVSDAGSPAVQKNCKDCLCNDCYYNSTKISKRYRCIQCDACKKSIRRKGIKVCGLKVASEQ